MNNIFSSVLSDNFYEKKSVNNRDANSYNSLDCVWLVEQLTKAALDVSVSRYEEGCLEKSLINVDAVSLPEGLEEDASVHCRTFFLLV
jgi:hypothetical protein